MQAEKTSADYYFDSYSHFGELARPRKHQVPSPTGAQIIRWPGP